MRVVCRRGRPGMSWCGGPGGERAVSGRYDEIADDGVATAAWKMSQTLEPAREAYVQATAAQPTFLEALLASLSGPQDGGVR